MALPRAAAAPVPDPWEDPVFREVDDSFRTLVRQLGKAGAGMVTALAAGRLVGDRLSVGRSRRAATSLTVGVQATLGLVALHLTSAHPIRIAVRAQRSLLKAAEHELRDELARNAFDAELRGALELVDDEVAALVLLGEAMGRATEAPVELLLADSSRAHVRQAAAAPGRAAPGCGVTTPWECPAVRSGRPQRFATTDALSCCPRLRERADGQPLQAACLPVTVLGQPAGVVHAVLPVATDADPQALRDLGAVAVQGGSRIGVLRAIARSQVRADTDPLTGLLNRRAFEERLEPLLDEPNELSVAFIDLDHFKALNDTYGHATGDRALRTMARVLRASTPANTLIGRYGGEEFILVAAASVEHTTLLLEGIRSSLGESLGAGDLPLFTLSAGVASLPPGTTFERAVANADLALLAAKTAGRDRIEVAAA